MMGDFYDKDGNRMELMEWAWKFEDKAYCRVGLDEREGIRVSTVWLGLDHNFSPDGPPLIFETMVFDDQDTRPVHLDERLPVREFSQDLTQSRYSTLEEAEAGHREHVKQYLDIMDLMDATPTDRSCGTPPGPVPRPASPLCTDPSS